MTQAKSKAKIFRYPLWFKSLRTAEPSQLILLFLFLGMSEISVKQLILLTAATDIGA